MQINQPRILPYNQCYLQHDLSKGQTILSNDHLREQSNASVEPVSS